MKKLILISFLILALFGCTKTAEKSLIDNQMALNQTIEANNLSADNLITVTGDENIAKIEIKSSNLQFPLKKYEKQFVNVGLHSEAFIKLDKSHIAFLDDNEAIWLTPMIRNNSGVLFNAIYSQDVDSCKSAHVNILGKDYNLGALKNASSFRGDDKWKILFDYNGTYCIKRVIIYMDGYFYNLKDGEQINLFRNDNTLVLSFELETEPKIRITAVRPTPKEQESEKRIFSSNNISEILIGTNECFKVYNITACNEGYNFDRDDGNYFILSLYDDKNNLIKKEDVELYPKSHYPKYILYENNTMIVFIDDMQYSSTGIAFVYIISLEKEMKDVESIKDGYAGVEYKQKETINESGINFEFDPAIQVCTDKNCSREEYLTERHQVRLNINNKDFAITKFGRNNVTLAKEQNSAFLNRYSCAVENDNTIKVGNKTLAVEEFYNRHKPNATAVFYSLDNSTAKMELSSGQTKEVNGDYLHVWYFGFDYTFCADWVGVSSLSEIIDLTDDTSIILIWENENSSNPALKSIFIPRSSQMFEKLIGS